MAFVAAPAVAPQRRSLGRTWAAAAGALLLACACAPEPAVPPATSAGGTNDEAGAGGGSPPRTSSDAGDAEPATATGASAAVGRPAPARLVAFGDVHGDFAATLAVLRLAGAIDAEENWSGGALVLVQTGDQLDRGDDEPEILALFDKLEDQARAAGGAFLVLNGNHEIMNAMTDLRYVTPEGFTDYAATSDAALSPEQRAQLPAEYRGRVAAFLPGSPLAREFATRPIVLVVGDTIFAHGGLTPRWAEHGIERINEEARAYLTAERAEVPESLTAEDGPIWSRDFSEAPDPQDCDQLAQTLEIVGARRMVVGHTVGLEGIRSACDERVWMIDVGMSSYYGGTPAALEITSAGVRALTG